MSDRLNGLIVVLEDNIRADDAEPLIKAIKMMRGVLTVNPVVDDITSHIAQSRAQSDIEKRVCDALFQKRTPK